MSIDRNAEGNRLVIADLGLILQSNRDWADENARPAYNCIAREALNRRQFLQTGAILAAALAGLSASEDNMDEQIILDRCAERIEQHRKGTVRIRLTDPAGNPLPGASLRARQTASEFLFGANIYMLDRFDDAGHNRAYREQFAHLLNYATLPFYWKSYEPQPGQPHTERLHNMARACREMGLKTKGHPLVWHETVPDWAPAGLNEIEQRLRGRVTQTIEEFAGEINVWDVVNEATVSARFDNPVGRWMKTNGTAACVAKSLNWARSASPGAVLIYNDYNITADYEKLLAGLIAQDAPFDVIGLQSHMHAGTWPIERAWSVCETYARFGRPLHFTEISVLSGALKTDGDWSTYRTDWHSTPQGETAQAEYVEALYRTLFSHPAVEAITWWDFSDAGAWLGAPSGLVRSDLSPKPVYRALEKLILGEWRTDFHGTADADGIVAFKGFGGSYDLHAGRGSAKTTSTLQINRGTETALTLVVK